MRSNDVLRTGEFFFFFSTGNVFIGPAPRSWTSISHLLSLRRCRRLITSTPLRQDRFLFCCTGHVCPIESFDVGTRCETCCCMFLSLFLSFFGFSFLIGWPISRRKDCHLSTICPICRESLPTRIEMLYDVDDL